jgi:hypothetical protein
MATARFADFIDRDGRNHGIHLRFVFPPYPLLGVPRSILRRYVEGDDPVTGQPIMQELVEALTKPVTHEERSLVVRQRPRRPRLLPSDTEENLQRMFVENGWTDGLPVVLPTEERVAEMLKGTGHAPDEVVGRMSITPHQEKFEYTVEKVAVNAVMAGARPEHLPVILAIAATQECSMPTSSGFGRMVIVNGPIRNEIGMNSGVAALSPFNLANAVIGRAWTLMTINFGDARLGETFIASTGHNANYNNMCCAENEEKSIWEPFHVQKGFKPEESVVTLFRGFNVLNFGVGPAEEMARVLKVFPNMGFTITLILDPLVAKAVQQQGFRTKQELSQWLTENVTMPAGEYWKHGPGLGFALSLARDGVQPFASWAKLPKEELIAPYHDENINLVVVGGENTPLWLTTDFAHTRSVSIDEWRPEGGIRMDPRPLRMPVAVACSDGSCGLPGRDQTLDAAESGTTGFPWQDQSRTQHCRGQSKSNVVRAMTYLVKEDAVDD